MQSLIKSVLIIFAFCSNLVAQIPNSGFENWSTVGSYNIPDGWGTLNHTTASYSVFTSEKATPGSPGASYLRVTSRTTGTFVTLGIAVSGILDTVTLQPKSGFPFNQQPESFTGKWQHMIFGTSQGSINVELTRWDSGTNSRVLVAAASERLVGMHMSWTNFSIPLVYFDSNLPDSCIITLRASGPAPTHMDYLWVDNLAFTGSVTGLIEKQFHNTGIKVFPNPVNNFLTVSSDEKTQSILKVELYDMKGKKVYEENFKNETLRKTIHLEGIPSGLYSLKVVTDDGIENKKIIIN